MRVITREKRESNEIIRLEFRTSPNIRAATTNKKIKNPLATISYLRSSFVGNYFSANLKAILEITYSQPTGNKGKIEREIK